MKHGIVVLILFFSLGSYSQDLVPYKDTINLFSIGIPVGWRYGISKDYPSIKLFAQEAVAGSDGLLANYNINIFSTSDSTFDKVYTSFIQSLRSTKNFQLLDSGNATINEIRYRWIMETHENSQAPIKMCNYDFMTYKNRTAYILTFVAPQKVFDRYKKLFDKVANSLRL